MIFPRKSFQPTGTLKTKPRFHFFVFRQFFFCQFSAFKHGWKLVKVARKKQLNTAKWLFIFAYFFADSIQNLKHLLGHHADLIYNQHLHVFPRRFCNVITINLVHNFIYRSIANTNASPRVNGAGLAVKHHCGTTSHCTHSDVLSPHKHFLLNMANKSRFTCAPGAS